MPTKNDLENALKDAMRAGDDLRKRTLRMALAAVRFAEIEKGVELDEPVILAILQKEIKSRQEAITDAERANRPDLASANTAEIAILEGFLPAALSSSELEVLAQQAITEVGATEPRDMGRVMKVLIPRLQGRATGDQASQVVRRLLQ